MTFWIATINPYKYAKSQLPHELIAFKTPCPNQQKSYFGSLCSLRIKLIFLVFYEELLHAAMCLKLPKGWRARCEEKSSFAHRLLVFHVFSHLFFFAHSSAWCHLQCDCYKLNVKFLIFSRNLTRSTMLKFWNKSLVNKKNSSSLIFTNMVLRF